jgi:hypothetical protein
MKYNRAYAYIPLAALGAWFLYKMYRVKQAADKLAMQFVGFTFSLERTRAIINITIGINNVYDTPISVKNTYGRATSYKGALVGTFNTGAYTLNKGYNKIVVQLDIPYTIFRDLVFEYVLNKAAGTINIEYTTELMQGVSKTEKQKINIDKHLKL